MEPSSEKFDRSTIQILKKSIFSIFVIEILFAFVKKKLNFSSTPDSGIDVGPTFIIFVFFPGPTFINF